MQAPTEVAFAARGSRPLRRDFLELLDEFHR
jgi:hypothetical protein